MAWVQFFGLLVPMVIFFGVLYKEIRDGRKEIREDRKENRIETQKIIARMRTEFLQHQQSSDLLRAQKPKSDP